MSPVPGMQPRNLARTIFDAQNQDTAIGVCHFRKGLNECAIR